MYRYRQATASHLIWLKKLQRSLQLIATTTNLVNAQVQFRLQVLKLFPHSATANTERGPKRLPRMKSTIFE
jgi:hypothetical protein